MMKVVSFLIKILKYIVLSFLVSNFDILADSLQQFTSNVKNTAIKDREVFNGSMQNLLNPIEDLV